MAEHAGDEQADQVQRHRDMEFERRHVERHRRQQCDQCHDEQRPHVPARVIEREDEAAEVEREGQHPQERYARNVLRDVVGDRQQHHRAHRGQREPLQLRRHGKRRGARRGRDLVGPEAVHRQPRGERAEDDEAGKHERPHPAELSQVERRLEQQRESDQRKQRSQVGKREQPVRHAAPEAAPVPRLQERRRRRQQEVGQADGGQQKQQDARDRLLVALRLPAARGEDRQEGER